MKMLGKKRTPGLWCMLAVMLGGYVLLHDLLGGTLFAHSGWDSYTLQALSWRAGTLYLPENYTWLELAVYNGHYYVSFPPVPTLVMLPLTFLFGANTPNNFVMMLYAMGAAAAAYCALRKTGTPDRFAAPIAFFYVWGSNLLWMSTNGGVWFQAQALALLLLTCALNCALRAKRMAAYTLVALAVGCRPFSVCAYLPLFVYFCRQDGQAGRTLAQICKGTLRALLPSVLIAGAYMAYNYARFESVWEFGHNYLPEFTEAAYGQFNPAYLWNNLKVLLFRPVTIEAGRLSFSYFNGFMFYVANPLFLLWFLTMLRRLVKRPPDDGRRAVRVALGVAILAELVLLCLHKTLGGWQFGARYTVDMLPMAFAFLLSCGPRRPRPYEWAVMALGIAFNAYGTLAINLFT